MSEPNLVDGARSATLIRWVMALALVGLLASLLIFRADWERWLPGSASAFAPAATPEVETPILPGPTLQSPALGAPLTAGPIPFQGLAAPQSRITVLVNGVASEAVTTADEMGQWNLTLTLNEPGAYTLQFQAALEQQQAASSSYMLHLLPPLPTAHLPAEGLELEGDTLVLTGEGAPGTLVQVVMDTTIIGQAVVDADGRWQVTAAPTLPGTYTVLTQVVDEDGQVLGQSFPQSLAVLPAFVPPSITSPPPDTVQKGILAVSGEGGPGGTIELLVNSEVISHSLVAEDGGWMFEVPLPPATYTVSVQGLDRHGVVRATTPPRTIILAPFFVTPTLTVDRPELLVGEALTLTGIAEPTTQLAILVNANPVAQVEVGEDGVWRYAPLTASEPGVWQLTAQSPTPEGDLLTSAPVTVSILPPPTLITPTVTAPQGSATYVAGEQKLSGVGDPLLSLALVINGGPDIPVALDATGGWSQLTSFEPGEYEILLVGRDATGAEVIRSTPLQLTVVPATPLPSCQNVTIYGLDRGNSYVVAPCETLARIAQRTGLTVQEIVAANPQLSDPDTLRVGQVLTLPRP